MGLLMESGVTDAEVTRLLRRNDSPLTPYLHKVGRRITNAAKRQVGKSTHRLASSIHYKLDHGGGLPGVWIGTYNNIARLHHEGTRPHTIRPVKAEFLRFSARGRIVYAREVRHPGTRPNRFLTDNIYLAKV